MKQLAEKMLKKKNCHPHGLPMSVHKNFQSSHLAGYRELTNVLFYYIDLPLAENTLLKLNWFV